MVIDVRVNQDGTNSKELKQKEESKEDEKTTQAAIERTLTEQQLGSAR